MTALAPAVESFFTGYLIAQRGASPHTIASYRDTLRLLFAWIREQSGTRPSDLDFADIDAATVSGFLSMLEDERHNTSRTRSQRLAAIHSLYRHAALGHPEHAALIARVLAIQPRRPSRSKQISNDVPGVTSPGFHDFAFFPYLFEFVVA